MRIQKAIFSIFKKGMKPFLGHQFARFYPVRISLNLLLWFFKKFNVVGKMQGNKISLASKVSLLLFIEGGQRVFETKIFKQQIKKGDIVLDLGANIGYYTLIAASLVGEDGKVFAFEPEPTNFSLLKKNIELNNYKNIVPINKAVSNRTGKSKLYLNKNDASMHTMGERNIKQSFIEIETIRIDDYFKNYDRKVNFIKVDIEGAEELAIQGISKLLEKNKNVKIFTEFNPSLLKNCGTNPEDYLNLLIQYGFKLYHINEEEKKLNFITSGKLMQKYSQGGYTNLSCVR